MADQDDPRDRPLPSSFDGDMDFYAKETFLHKIARKVREEPLIPLGMGLTVAALINAMRASRRGDSHTVQRMFRARVAAQAFTVAAMAAGGMYYSKDRQRAAELRKVQHALDAEEKRIRWIKELEIRDEEDKARARDLEAKRAARRAERDAERMHAEKAEAEADTEAVATGKAGGRSGGILASLGLASSGRKAVDQEGDVTREIKHETTVAAADIAAAAAAAAAASDIAHHHHKAPAPAPAEEPKKARRENPRSTLSELTRMMGKKKPPEDGPKPEGVE